VNAGGASLDQIVAKAIEKERHLAACRRDLSTFAEHLPGTERGPFRTSRWQKHMCDVLMAASLSAHMRESPRILLEAPPQFGKSELVARRWPIWHMGRYGGTCAIASYGKDLALDHSRGARTLAWSPQAREVFPHFEVAEEETRKLGYKRRDTSLVSDWAVGAGRYFATSIGGALTGKTTRLIVVDDPLKDRAAANSATERQKAWEWFTSVVLTRAEANGAGIVVMHTRWHEDDLAGRLIRKMEQGGTQYQRMTYRALAEEDDILGRPVGASLDPSLRTRAQLLQTQIDVGEEDWLSLYQQRPSSKSGSLILRDWIQRYTANPRDIRTSMDWVVVAADTAGTAKKTSDYTAAVVVGYRDGCFWLLHYVNERLSYVQQRAMLRQLCADWRPDSVVVEGRSTGDAIVDDLRSVVPGIRTVNPTTDKVQRLAPTLPLWQAHQVLIPDAKWFPRIGEVIEQLVTFPASPNDDFVDALVYALLECRRLVEIGDNVTTRALYGDTSETAGDQPSAEW
jgi:predicted phage terminase large subunit-like protein